MWLVGPCWALKLSVLIARQCPTHTPSLGCLLDLVVCDYQQMGLTRQLLSSRVAIEVEKCFEVTSSSVTYTVKW